MPSPPRLPIRRRAVAALALLGTLGGVWGHVAPSAPTPAPLVAAPTWLMATLSDPIGSYPRPEGTEEAFSSPAIADVGGDARPEIISAGIDGDVIAWDTYTWTIRWKQALDSSVRTSPTVAALDRDGRPNDVVVGTDDGRVVWIDGPTGAIRRTFTELPPLHCPPLIDCRPHGFFGTPAVGDVNRDGRPEIVAASYDHSVYAWDPATGALRWRQYLWDTLWSSPRIADIDRNGSMEVVLGGDLYPNNPHGFAPGGLLWVLRGATGAVYPGYPRGFPDQTIWSSPAIADMNLNGTLEIVVGTGTNYPNPGGWQVHALGATGGTLAGWPVATDGRVIASPAVGNLDGDARLEVAVASEGGWVYAFDNDGTRLWRACNAQQETSCRSASGTDPGFVTHGSAVIADVDGDGQQEVVSALDKHLRVYDGATGQVESSLQLPSNTFRPAAGATVGEVDGRTVLVQQAPANVVGGGLGAGDEDRIYVATTDQPLCEAHWPTFGHDAARSGRYDPGPPSWYPFACARRFVERQYADFLNRPPDPAGLQHYSDRLRYGGASGNWVVRAFMASSEFEGVVAPVVRLHLGIVGDPPADLYALQSQVAAFRAAPTGATLAQVATGLLTDAGLDRVPPAELVATIWRRGLGGEPTTAELESALADLEAGLSPADLVVRLLSGPTATKRLRPPVQVTMAYLGMLHRTPDPEGFGYWVDRARAGLSLGMLIKGFQHSPEYRQVTGR